MSAAFLDNWGEPIDPHVSEDCPTCGGSMFYKLPFGCDNVTVECEDEDNCECDCHFPASSKPDPGTEPE